MSQKSVTSKRTITSGDCNEVDPAVKKIKVLPKSPTRDPGGSDIQVDLRSIPAVPASVFQSTYLSPQVVFEVGDPVVYMSVHRAILLKCDTFKAALKGSLGNVCLDASEENRESFDFRHVRKEVFDLFADFLYTGDYSLNKPFIDSKIDGDFNMDVLVLQCELYFIATEFDILPLRRKASSAAYAVMIGADPAGCRGMVTMDVIKLAEILRMVFQKTAKNDAFLRPKTIDALKKLLRHATGKTMCGVHHNKRAEKVMDDVLRDLIASDTDAAFKIVRQAITGQMSG